jgi:methionine synthase I (cobalamin-dependent)
LVRDRFGMAWEFGGYPNGSVPDPVHGYSRMRPCTLDEFLRQAERILDSGAALIGSCCGTTPEHTRALAALLRRRGER